ncbi:MAG: hypothetical protein EAZ15_01880 [Sphingobacteriales bacterium]|nr:MAG: hypothetical protein EAZ15_01880 [Sphingobacteriales bacterium]
MKTKPNNVILACYFTGVYDVNRNQILADNDFSKIESWAAPMAAQKILGIVFHNSLTDETCQLHTNKYLQFIKVELDSNYSPNVYRYFLYNTYLQNNKVDNVFITDSTDVVALQNPFIQPLFTNNNQAIFCGDEPQILNNPWMDSHSKHLRSVINNYAAYEEKHKNSTLLNCGIVGGSFTIMQFFLDKICQIHRQYNSNNKTAYTGDMGAFNYLLRTQFNDNIIHGQPVNTIFKAYENERLDCWFAHK